MECGGLLKLVIDCRGVFRLGGAMDIDDVPSRDLIARLFALLTTRAEDAAGLAAEGQSHIIGSARAHELADRLQVIGQHITIIAEALSVIIAKSRG